MSPTTDISRIVLASASPRRKLLLEEMGVPFTVFPANVEEHEEPDSCPRETVLHNARIKAEHVAAQFSADLVLGCDTIVALGDEVLHKPLDLDDACAMLTRLSGQTHEVYTGVCLIARDWGIDEAHYITSKVTFKPFDRATIDQYFQLVNPLDKAGAYGIQQGREMIIADVEGSVRNVMGLPIEFLRSRLDDLNLFPKEEVTS